MKLHKSYDNINLKFKVTQFCETFRSDASFTKLRTQISWISSLVKWVHVSKTCNCLVKRLTECETSTVARLF